MSFQPFEYVLTLPSSLRSDERSDFNFIVVTLDTMNLFSLATSKILSRNLHRLTMLCKGLNLFVFIQLEIGWAFWYGFNQNWGIFSRYFFKYFFFSFFPLFSAEIPFTLQISILDVVPQALRLCSFFFLLFLFLSVRQIEKSLFMRL